MNIYLFDMFNHNINHSKVQYKHVSSKKKTFFSDISSNQHPNIVPFGTCDNHVVVWGWKERLSRFKNVKEIQENHVIRR
jgi:hypothetical protein